MKKSFVIVRIVEQENDIDGSMHLYYCKDKKEMWNKNVLDADVEVFNDWHEAKEELGYVLAIANKKYPGSLCVTDLKIGETSLNVMEATFREGFPRRRTTELTEEELANFAKRKIEEGDDELALSCYDILIEFNPVKGEYYWKRHFIKDRAEDYEGAVEDLNKAIELDPEKAARCFWERSKLKEYFLKDEKGAMKDRSKAIELNPEYSEYD